MKVNQLTHAEEQLMLIIWKLGSPFMRDIMAALPDPKPHQNTVSTYLKILQEKEFLTCKKFGRIHQYVPLINIDEYAQFLTDYIIKNYYNNSVKDFSKKFFIKHKLSHQQNINLAAQKPLSETKDAEIAEFVNTMLDQNEKGKKKKKKEKKKKKHK